MRTEFSVQMTQKRMFRFLMYHTYHSPSGWFGVALGIALLGLSAWTFAKGEAADTSGMLYLFFGCYFLLFQPVLLYLRAAKQVRLNPVFKDPITYVVDDAGISSRQKEQEARIGWEQVVKAVGTRRDFYLYVGKASCCIFPKECMGDGAGAVEALARKHLDAKRVRL